MYSNTNRLELDIAVATLPRPPKTETLSLRLNPKTKFMLEFTARATRRSVTSVVELAIEDSAQQTKLDDAHGYSQGSTWQDFWDPEESIRTFKLIANPKWANYEEELLFSFISDHWPFFYTTPNKTLINRKNIQVLWPKINDYLEEFLQNRSIDYHSAGNLMAKDMAAATLTPPAWPQPAVQKTPVPVSQKRSFAADLEDDIPF